MNTGKKTGPKPGSKTANNKRNPHDAKQCARLDKLLKSCVEAGLKYAQQVLLSTKQIEVKVYNRDGLKEKFKRAEFSPEIKARFLEMVIGKVYAEKRDLGIAPQDPNTPVVVGFNFIPLGKKNKTGKKDDDDSI